MKANEAHKLTPADLTAETERLRMRLYELRVQSVTEKLENPRELGNVKRDIARILTEQRMRQIKAKG